MRRQLTGIRARLGRLEAACQAEARTVNWDALVQRLCSARTEPVEVRVMTPDEFTAWAERLRSSARGSEYVKITERLIAAQQRETLRALKK
jgi:hypothetical protein